MNQTEATAKMASVINDALIRRRDGTVTVGSPVDHEGPDVLLVSFGNGLVLSVTVEILAQP